jgi:colicin import membrane protein
MPRTKSTTTTTRSRTSRTKADLAADLAALQAGVSSADVSDPKTQELQRARETEVRTATKDVSVEKVVETIGKTTVDVSRSLNAVSEQLVAKVQELETTTAAVALAQTELEQLHGKEVVASSIQSLLADHAAKVKDLDDQIAQRRAEWAKEEQQHLVAVRERDAELAKIRAREQADYNYNQTIKVRAAEQDFAEKARVQQVANRDKQEILERNWAERDAQLKAKENRLAELEAQVAAFPENLKKEVAREVAIATNAQKKDYEFKIQLMDRDSKSATDLLRQQLSSTEAQNKLQTATIGDLQAKLADAQKQVSEIASKALESASGALALDKVMNTRSNGDVPQRGKA